MRCNVYFSAKIKASNVKKSCVDSHSPPEPEIKNLN